MNLTIPVNRKRFPLLLVAGLFISVFLSRDFLIMKKEMPGFDGVLNEALLLPIIVLLNIFTLVALVEYIKTLFDKKAVLTINEDGIYDNLSIFSCGHIPWETIAAFDIVQVYNSDYLLVRLNNPELVLQRQNPVKRFVLKRYIKRWGTPCAISQKRITYNLHELRTLLLTQEKI
jgi:hypothetical protein